MKYKSLEVEAEENMDTFSLLRFLRKLTMNSCIINVALPANLRNSIYSILLSDSLWKHYCAYG